MTAPHTQGRLVVGERVGDRVQLKHTHGDVPGAISLVVAQVTARESWRAEGEANARRLAACWNACEGLETSWLEGVKLGDFPVTGVHKELEEAMAERDQLRAELEAARALLAEKFEAPPAGTPVETIAYLARRLVNVSDLFGTVVTITQRPRLPLAMGNYDTVVEVRPARGCY